MKHHILNLCKISFSLKVSFLCLCFYCFAPSSSCVSIVYMSLFAFTSISSVLAHIKLVAQSDHVTKQLQLEPEFNNILHEYVFDHIQGIMTQRFYFKEWRQWKRLQLRKTRKLEYLSSSLSFHRCRS